MSVATAIHLFLPAIVFGRRAVCAVISHIFHHLQAVGRRDSPFAYGIELWNGRCFHRKRTLGFGHFELFGLNQSQQLSRTPQVALLGINCV